MNRIATGLVLALMLCFFSSGWAVTVPIGGEISAFEIPQLLVQPKSDGAPPVPSDGFKLSLISDSTVEVAQNGSYSVSKKPFSLKVSDFVPGNTSKTFTVLFATPEVVAWLATNPTDSAPAGYVGSNEGDSLKGLRYLSQKKETVVFVLDDMGWGFCVPDGLACSISIQGLVLADGTKKELKDVSEPLKIAVYADIDGDRKISNKEFFVFTVTLADVVPPDSQGLWFWKVLVGGKDNPIEKIGSDYASKLETAQAFTLELDKIDSDAPLYFVVSVPNKKISCNLMEQHLNGKLEAYKKKVGAEEYGRQFAEWVKAAGSGIGSAGKTAWSATKAFGTGVVEGFTGSSPTVPGPDFIPDTVPDTGNDPSGSSTGKAFSVSSSVELRRVYAVNPAEVTAKKSQWAIRSIDKKEINSTNFKGENYYVSACQFFLRSDGYHLLNTQEAYITIGLGVPRCANLFECLGRIDWFIADALKSLSNQ